MVIARYELETRRLIGTAVDGCRFGGEIGEHDGTLIAERPDDDIELWVVERLEL